MYKPRRRWWLRWRTVLPIVAAIVAGGAFAAWRLLREPGNISHPNLPGFTVPAPVAPPKIVGERFTWSEFGYDGARTHYLPAPSWLRPPFIRGWTLHGHVLLEFPPVLDGLSLYQLRNNGTLQAISRRTGRLRWRRGLGKLAASSPAAGHGRVFVTLLMGVHGGRHGRVVALSERTGQMLWSRQLPSRAESSPLLSRGRIYFGTENGKVYALSAKDGSLRWTFRAGGAVKGGLALDGGKLYVASYGGHVYAVRATDGHQMWSVGTNGTHFGLGSGNFYATPAVAFGRVFVGNTDGRVYAFSTANGKLAWAHQTGNYVYGSAAVANVPGRGPTVYVGSYSGKFYALDARSGRVRWAHKAGGRISGSPVLVGDVVYYSYLPPRNSKRPGGTAGLDAHTGRRIFAFPRGAFNPGVSDGRHFFLVGFSSLTQFTPRNAPKESAKPPAAPRKRRAAKRSTASHHARKRVRHKAKRHRTAKRKHHG